MDDQGRMPPQTRLGPVALAVSRLAPMLEFYRAALGMALLRRGNGEVELGAQARFFALGGYHHHVGVNTWAGKELPPRAADQLGLLYYSF